MRLIVYGAAAFMPAFVAMTRESFRERGMANDGPSRTVVITFATVESAAGAFCATIGLWMVPLAVIAFIALASTCIVDLAMAQASTMWTAELGDGGLRLRAGERQLEFSWSTLRIRRRGPTLLFHDGEKAKTLRFGGARAEEIADEARRRGATLTSESFVGGGLLVPFLMATACTLLAAAFLKQ